MASYYYLISSLPTLSPTSKLPFDYDGFLSLCRGSVSDKVYKALENPSDDEVSAKLVKQWNAFYCNLMDELNYLRKQKLGYQCTAPSYVSPESESAANAAMNASDPLEAEKIILKAQFDHLDSLVSMHYFDETVLFGYAIKLRLLQRQAAFNEAEGKEEFKRLFDSIQQQILSI